MIEICQDKRIGEENSVVEERLSRHQRKADEGAAWIELKERRHDVAQGRIAPLAQARRRRGDWRERLPAKVLLDEVDDRCAFLGAAVRHQPARALGYPQAHEIDDGSEHRADKEREAPSGVGREERLIKNDDRADGPGGGADPEAAVDRKIGPAAIACRDEFLNRRVDGGILAADPGTGEKAERCKARNIPGKGGSGSERHIDQQSDEEEHSATEPVSQPAEEQRARDSAKHVGGAGKTDVGAGELQTAPDGAREGPRESDSPTTENPGDAERKDDKPMEPAPRKPVQTGRNIGFDDGAVHL